MRLNKGDLPAGESQLWEPLQFRLLGLFIQDPYDVHHACIATQKCRGIALICETVWQKYWYLSPDR